jgi:hypothetical protein
MDPTWEDFWFVIHIQCSYLNGPLLSEVCEMPMSGGSLCLHYIHKVLGVGCRVLEI